MVDCKILIKYSTSKCNEELLGFLIRNISDIRKRYALQVLVVFDENIPMLKGVIKKLPALILRNNVITGNSAIRKTLLPSVGSVGSVGSLSGMKNNDLHDFWSEEIHGKDDNNMDEATDIMESVKSRAMQQSVQHREKSKKTPKQRKTIVSGASENIAMSDIQGGTISDLVADDPMMAKFWENQEETPM